MSLTPELVAAALYRCGVIGEEQMLLVGREAKLLVPPAAGAASLEQRAWAYEVIEQLRLAHAKEPKRTVGEFDIVEALAQDTELVPVRIDPLTLNADFIESRMSRPFARRHRMLPLGLEEGRLLVACANPYDLEGIDSYRRIAGREIELQVASEREILRAINEFYGLRYSVKRAQSDLEAGLDLGNLEQLVRMRSAREIESSDEHIVNAVEFMLQHAYDTRASDIHLEPKREFSLVRFRIDGVLHDIQTVPKLVHKAVVNRIKTMSRLDIAEKRRPQDGRVKTQRAGLEIELRVSTLPVAFGEKVVMRIFDPQVISGDLDGLGFFPDELRKVEDFITRPHGILLVTGPTGSGKTTTLYSALKLVAGREVNVVTIEDPIEMVDEELNQTAVQPKAGVTFASALRSILRQDPDVIMVGEIRDGETAQYAVQAALTGHLVLSTLHTNDAASAITRMADLGIEPFLISSTLIGSVAQRLVRKVCPLCTAPHILSDLETETLGVTPPEGQRIKVARGEGCAECRQTGHFGRTGIFEVLAMDEALRHLVSEGAAAAELKREAVKNGMRTLRQSALRKLANGETSYQEVVRITAV